MRILILLLLWPYFVWAAIDDKPPFFQISNNENRAWLLGTIHIGTADFYPLPAQIEQAFAKASVLAFEADPNDPSLPQLLLRYGRSDVPLPASLAWQVRAYCQRNQLDCDLALSPWLLSSQLAMAQSARAGYQAQYGVEAQLLVKREQRPLWQLEGMAKQIAIFADLPISVQHNLLAASLNDDDPKPLIEAWRKGDQAGLYQLIQQSMADEPELWQVLISERNKDMADTISSWLGQQDQIFIAVGAGHLLGEEGIPVLLNQAGFTVKNCWQQHCE